MDMEDDSVITMNAEFELISRPRAIALAILLAFGNFYAGYCGAIFNPLAKPMLYNVYEMDADKDKDKIALLEGAFNAVFSVGAMTGAFATGSLADLLGRRPLLILSEVIALLTCLLYITKGIPYLLAARFISGVVAGMSNIGFIIISELLPNKISGIGNTAGYIASTTAMLLGFATQNILTNNQMVEYWCYLLSATAVISVLRLILFPIFLRTDTVKFQYLSSQKDEAYDRVLLVMSSVYTPKHADTAAKEAISTFNKQAEESSVGLSSLFRTENRMRLFSGCFLAFAQQLCGINFFIYYSTAIYDSINGSGKTMTLVIGIANFLSGFIAMALVGRFGRKFNIVWACLLQAISLGVLLIGIQTKQFILLASAACVYITAFAIGLGGTYTAYLCEILPLSGVGLAVAIQWILTAAIAQGTPILNKTFGQYPLLSFFAATCFVLFFGLASWIIETKDKKEQQIIEKFRSSKFLPFDFS